jgi:NAD(P)-dependent dehydrogenase (short-subunit alcohol dehydrogenase family)
LPQRSSCWGRHQRGRVGEIENELAADYRYRFSYIAANLASVSDVVRVFKWAGTLRCCTTLVNAAGIGLSKSLGDHGESDWDTVIDVKHKGLFLRLQAAERQMRSAGAGVIVDIGPMVGFTPPPMPEIAYV